MRVDDYVDVFGPASGLLLQRFGKWLLSGNSVHRRLLGRPLLADASLNQNLFLTCIDENTVHDSYDC